MFLRQCRDHIAAALSDTPVTLVVGPRRSGKTTLVREFETEQRKYVTLDDHLALEQARADPMGFLLQLGDGIIDEVQRAPGLIMAIKRSVDEKYGPGRFLLTGSANVMTLPTVGDSLAGRMETIRLLPLSGAELAGGKRTFLSQLFDMRGRFPLKPRVPKLGPSLVEAVLQGGYPEVMSRSPGRRDAWYRSYLGSVLTRDLRDIAVVEKLTSLPKFVQLLAEHSGQMVNYSGFGAALELTNKTSQRYVELLERIYIVATLAPWYSNRIKRLIKTPKLHFIDSGLLASVRRFEHMRAGWDRTGFGPLLETFVFSEVLKLLDSPMEYFLYHYRDHQQNEVDFVLERSDGLVAGIEVKASSTVAQADFKGLRIMADALGKKFAAGVVLYDGDTAIPVGDRLTAVPLSFLWE